MQDAHLVLRFGQAYQAYASTPNEWHHQTLGQKKVETPQPACSDAPQRSPISRTPPSKALALRPNG